MKLFAVIAMATWQNTFQPGNEYGWTSYGQDHDLVLARAKELEGKVAGVTLQRACGSLQNPRKIDTSPTGKDILVYPASPDDNPYPIELAEGINRVTSSSGHGMEVFLFAGPPLSAATEAAARKAVLAGGHIIGADSIGRAATHGKRWSEIPLTVEPFPMPDADRPRWFDRSLRFFTSTARARVLARLGHLVPPHVHIVCNGADDSDSAYQPLELDFWRRRGNPLHIPAHRRPDGTSLLDQYLAHLSETAQ